ncbi:MAG: hypothetical protein Q9207_007195 [Kuettlingeria erythrocarpa]
MCTPPPSLSSIESNKHYFYSDYVLTEAQDSVLSGLSAAVMKPQKGRPKPTVRFPPLQPPHAGQQGPQQGLSSTSRHHDDSLAKSTPAWQELFKGLMAKRDSTATKSSNVATAAPIIIDLSNKSVSDDAASSGMIEDQGPVTEANRTGKKKRRRHRAGKGKRKREANPDSEVGNEALEPPALKTLDFRLSQSSAALLLQNSSDLKATAAASTTTDSSDESISGDAISDGIPDEEVINTGTQYETGKTRRGRRGGSKKSRTDLIDLDNETEHEAFHTPLLKAVKSTISPSSAALLLQNASNNWMKVCHLLKDEVGPNDRDILQQIMYLISRLGTDSNQTSANIDSTSIEKDITPKAQNSLGSMLNGDTKPEHGRAPCPPEG